ncbi:hypothetical protein GCM10023084_02830 [Streptomyces lacrimifluminis]|uniref:hypothetical protein n=1 Tax=Streptomyces lacrimifluminis TaxID=1500077 RepID=UPI0031ECAED3
MTATPLTEQQLDEITAKVAELRERLDRKNPWPSDNESYFVAEGWTNGTRNALDKLHVESLVAEVRRLRTVLAAEERSHGDTIDDRDQAHEIADKLAYAVAPEGVIGEHSSMNCPWTNALDLITPKAEVDKLRAELAAVHAFLDEQDRAARLFELPTPAWVEAVRAASAAPAAPPTASHGPAGDRDGETGTEDAAGREGDSGTAGFETEISVRGRTA